MLLNTYGLCQERVPDYALIMRENLAIMRQLCVLNPLFMRNYVISDFFVFVLKILQFLLKVIYLFKGIILQKGLYYFLKVIFINKHKELIFYANKSLTLLSGPYMAAP